VTAELLSHVRTFGRTPPIAASCHTIFLGALAGERPERLYARLGFQPVTLTRSWVRKLPDANHH
jgi:hypothetical protein